VAEAQELNHLREENAKLKKLVAEYALDKEALKLVISKNGYARRRDEMPALFAFGSRREVGRDPIVEREFHPQAGILF